MFHISFDDCELAGVDVYQGSTGLTGAVLKGD